MNNKALIDQGFSTDVKDLVEKAAFKKAQDLEVKKEYEGSAKAFAEFSGSMPKALWPLQPLSMPGSTTRELTRFPRPLPFIQRLQAIIRKKMKS